MAWTKFTVPEKPSTSGTGVKVTLSKRATAPAKMLMTFTATLAKQFGWSGNDKLEVLIGEGPHHGSVRLRKNNSVGSATVEEKTSAIGSKATYFKVVLGIVPGLVDRAEAARWAAFEEAEDAWVEIRLPSWATETSPAKIAQAKTTALVADAAGFQRPRRDITSNMMGDPSPSRSALGAKK